MIATSHSRLSTLNQVVVSGVVEYKDSDVDPQSADHTRLVALLFEAMKEAQQLIDKPTCQVGRLTQ